MTPTDDEILAAADECGCYVERPAGHLLRLYRAAYAAGRLAGMEEAANIARWYAAHADVVGHPLSMAAIDRAVDAIRAAKEST